MNGIAFLVIGQDLKGSLTKFGPSVGEFVSFYNILHHDVQLLRSDRLVFFDFALVLFLN